MIENNGAGGENRTLTEGLPPQDFKSRGTTIALDQKHARNAIFPLSGATVHVGSRWYELPALGSPQGQSRGQGQPSAAQTRTLSPREHVEGMPRRPHSATPAPRSVNHSHHETPTHKIAYRALWRLTRRQAKRGRPPRPGAMSGNAPRPESGPAMGNSMRLRKIEFLKCFQSWPGEAWLLRKADKC